MPTLSHLLLIGKVISVIFSVSYTRLRLALRSLTHRLTYHPSSPSSSSEPLNIVIIGASFAGYHAARCLANSVPSGHRVVVVERNSHFQFTWVFPRFCVIRGGGHERKAFVPYGPYLGGGLERGSCVWVRGSVEKIEEEKNDNQDDDDGKDEEKGGCLVLRSGEKIKYEYLVVATGSAAELPSRVGKEDKADGIRLFRDMQDRIEAAKDVVVLGGGPAGVELAADAKALYPGKNVTLLHSRTRLMNGSFGPKMHEVAVKELEKLGVDLVLGERAQLPAADTETLSEVVLDSGKRIPCDCLIKCIGQKPNSSLIAELSPSSITESGHIKVLPTLQIADEAHRNIYAIGDVADTGSIKNGRAAIEQAQFVAENIVRAIKGKKPLEYHPQWFEGFTELTLGLDKSVMYFNDGSAEIILPHRSKDVALRSDQCWRLFGVKPFEDPSDLEAAKA
ncbi:hypothetical protein VTN00DRAFT_8354 [Thermoascus crustaceus]|uniref:uncharacterized protein n=1 Tax=Thermoascus crustaceus TaxID=5088 RepID=UPI003743EC51